MSAGTVLTDAERVVLSRAGFTEREISLHRQKFKNLLQISPFLTAEFEEFQRQIWDPVVFGQDIQEGLSSFRERRKPVWKNR